jgi:hypothetical protein
MNKAKDIHAEPMTDRPIYYVSDRPEAYEICGEIGHEEARRIGELIAARAGRQFPGVEFRVDSAWHSHQHGMEEVMAYIEARWQDWVAASGRERA